MQISLRPKSAPHVNRSPAEINLEVLVFILKFVLGLAWMKKVKLSLHRPTLIKDTVKPFYVKCIGYSKLILHEKTDLFAFIYKMLLC